MNFLVVEILLESVEKVILRKSAMNSHNNPKIIDKIDYPAKTCSFMIAIVIR